MLDATAATVGDVITLTVTVCVALHVPPLDPVTVYVVFVVGEAVAVAVVTLPAFALQV